MNLVPLAEVAEINPKTVMPSGTVGGTLFDFLPMADVSEDGFVNVTTQRSYDEVQKGFTAFRQGDLLVAKITPCFENNKIALANIATEIGFGSTEFHVIRCKNNVLHAPYVLHLIRSDVVRADGKRRMTGSAGQQRVPKTFLEELSIPLPPLEEQKRIAAILDQADDTRRKRQHAIDRLNQLGQAIFHEMFGDPVINPHGFQKISLGEMLKVSSGSGLIAADQMGGDYPVYGGNGINGWHNDFTVSSGTIVIGRVGAYCGAVHVTNRSAWVTDNALVVSLKIPVNQTYLAAALKIANLNQYAGRAAQPLISGSRMYPIEILNPPIKNQEFYETKMRLLEKIFADNAEVESSLDGLFSSLQHRAFTGQL